MTEIDDKDEISTTVDMGSLLKQLLDNSYLSQNEWIKNQWLVLFSQDVILANNTQQDIFWQMNQFDILRLRTLKLLPGHEYSGEISALITNLRMIFQAKLRRSINGFEREAETKQTIENKEPAQDPMHSSGYRSLLNRITGW